MFVTYGAIVLSDDPVSKSLVIICVPFTTGVCKRGYLSLEKRATSSRDRKWKAERLQICSIVHFLVYRSPFPLLQPKYLWMGFRKTFIEKCFKCKNWTIKQKRSNKGWVQFDVLSLRSLSTDVRSHNFYYLFKPCINNNNNNKCRF